MISLAILAGVLCGSSALVAWALAWTGRRAGSKRGRFRYGLLAVLLLSLVDLLGIAFAARLAAGGTPPVIPPVVTIVVLKILVFWGILKFVFQLTRKRTLLVFLVVILFTGINLAFAEMILKPYFIEAFVTSTTSMRPTIEPGDRFLANKLLRLRRWDLVAFHNQNKMNDGPDVLCKRVVGLPGERLRFHDGDLYVNEQPVSAPAVLSGRMHAFVFNRALSKYSDDETIVLGTDDFFFMGDNTARSVDSRICGPWDRSSLIGVIDAIYWPLGRFKVLR